MHVTVDGRKSATGGGFAAQIDLLARTSASDQPLVLRGRVEREVRGRGEAPLEDLELHARGIDPTSTELQTALETSAGELVEFARSTKLAGHVDLDLRRVRAWVRSGSVHHLEIVPAEGAELELPGLELFAIDLSGRVVARLEEDPPVEGRRLASTELWVTPLTGSLETSRGPLPMALRARLLPSGAFEADVFVTGLDPSDGELLARVQQAFALESGAGGESGGRLRLRATRRARRPVATADGPDAREIHLHPRRLALGPPAQPVLADLDGELLR